MLHPHRHFGIASIQTPEQLAEKLTRHTWTLCTGFFLQSHPLYLFLNDSFSEDGAQEYAVIKSNREGTHTRQIETITFGWCDQQQALELVRDIIAGEYDTSEFAHTVVVKIEPGAHHHCGLCA